MGVDGQRHVPAALRPRMTRYPLYRRLGGPQGLSKRVRKISPSLGFDPRTAQARSQSLYRLRYPAHQMLGIRHNYEVEVACEISKEFCLFLSYDIFSF